MALTSHTELSVRWLFSSQAALLVWAPIGMVIALHYGTPPDPHWVHDLARRLYYVPIVLAGSRSGFRGGVFTALVVVVSYLPHAFLHLFHDPGTSTEKGLEMFFYVLLGGTSGLIAERSAAEKNSLAALSISLQQTLDDLERREQELRRAARLDSLGELTAGLAHEIRNPLHAMRGTAEILLDAVPIGSTEVEMGRRHLAEIDRLSSFLGRFLSFAKGQPTCRREVDLSEIFEQVVALLSAQAAKQGTALQLLLRSEQRVYVDVDQLIQVCLGIGINALQALGSGGQIHFDCVFNVDDPGRIGISIENTGPPIPDALLNTLFDPFVSTRETGTGLGLSMAWRIVEAHGGFLEVENVPGGVDFRVWLPACEQ